MAKPCGLNFALTLVSFVGLGLSIYSFVIEQQNDDYTALCDISETISCSKTFKSKYGTGFGIVQDVLGKNSFLNKPNSLLGIGFYSLMIVIAQSNNKTLSLIAYANSILSIVISVYLAYVMLTVVKVVCVVCLSTYVVNIVNLFLSYTKYNVIKNEMKLKRN